MAALGRLLEQYPTIQIQRAIDQSTSDRFWQGHLERLVDFERHSKRIWLQTQPWIDHETGQRDGVQRDIAPCPGGGDLAARWEVVAAGIREQVDDTSWDLWLSGLHPHSLDDTGWTVGIAPERRGVAARRFATVLTTSSGGKPVRLVDCVGGREADAA